METLALFETRPIDINEIEWRRAAQRECVQFGDHGTFSEHIRGREVCFDCGGTL